MTKPPIDLYVERQRELNLNKQKWEYQVEELARYLCFMKGEDPDSIYYTDTGSTWQTWQFYIQDAEQYLRRRAMNKHYWENLAAYNND